MDVQNVIRDHTMNGVVFDFCVWVVSSLNTRLLHVPMETRSDCVSKVQ